MSGRLSIVSNVGLAASLLLAPLRSASAQATEAPSATAFVARPPTSEAEATFWLENMVVHHQFTDDEIAAATGWTLEKVKEAVASRGLRDRPIPSHQVGKPIRIMPYPGGRHPRIGFLDGAVDPQRETKFSVFMPWDPRAYVVLDIPEAIWSQWGLLYLAHTHVPTVWTEQGIALEPLEWDRSQNGVLHLSRRLPNNVVYEASVFPQEDAVMMELSLTNGTNETLVDLRVQNCVMFRGAPEFTEQTNVNKVFSTPYCACRNSAGTRWVITAWEPYQRVWVNQNCPCMHSDPQFPDCPPRETRTVRGWLSFYEGKDIESEIRRIHGTGWNKQ